jgi:hypothetical protein
LFLTLIAAVAVAVAVATTATAGPVKSGTYDFDPARYADMGSVSMSVAADGKKVKYIYFTLATKCRLGKRRSAYPTTLSNGKKPLRIRGGAFKYSRVIRYPNGAVHDERFTGKFAADGRSVTLVGRYKLKRPDGGCDTKTVRSTAKLVGLARPGPFPGPWSATTAAGQAITFDVERTRVTNVRAHATLTCDDGTTLVRDVRIPEVAIEDGQLSHDNLDARVETFEIEGTVLAREFKPDPESPGDNIVCSAADKFTAIPARPLDS